MSWTNFFVVGLTVVASVGCTSDDSGAGADGGEDGFESEEPDPTEADPTADNPFGGADYFYEAGDTTWPDFLDDLSGAACGDRFFFERGGVWEVAPGVGDMPGHLSVNCQGEDPIIVGDYGDAEMLRPNINVIQEGGAWGTLADATEWSENDFYNVQFYSLEFRCPECNRDNADDAAFFIDHHRSGDITFYNVRIDGFSAAVLGGSVGMQLINSQLTNNFEFGLLGALPHLKVRGTLFSNNGCGFLPRGDDECIFEHAIYQLCAPGGEVPECDDSNSGVEFTGNLFINNNTSGSGDDVECGGSNLVGLIGNGLRFEQNVMVQTNPMNGNCFIANSGGHAWEGLEECHDCVFSDNIMLNPSVGFDLNTTQNAQVDGNFFLFDENSLGGNGVAISSYDDAQGTSASDNVASFLMDQPADWTNVFDIVDGEEENNMVVNEPVSSACAERVATAADPTTYALPIDTTVAFSECR